MIFIILYIILFPVLVGVIWAAACASLSMISGWHALGKRFATKTDLNGDTYRWVSGSMGRPFAPSNYRGSLNVAVTEAGLGLRKTFPFRIMSPDLLIPWHEIEFMTQKQQNMLGIYSPKITIDVRDSGNQITLRGDFVKDIYNKYLLEKVENKS